MQTFPSARAVSNAVSASEREWYFLWHAWGTPETNGCTCFLQERESESESREEECIPIAENTDLVPSHNYIPAFPRLPHCRVEGAAVGTMEARVNLGRGWRTTGQSSSGWRAAHSRQRRRHQLREWGVGERVPHNHGQRGVSGSHWKLFEWEGNRCRRGGKSLLAETTAGAGVPHVTDGMGTSLLPAEAGGTVKGAGGVVPVVTVVLALNTVSPLAMGESEKQK